jgi:hypothetical protein
MDLGLAWLFDVLGQAEHTLPKRHKRPAPRKQRA